MLRSCIVVCMAQLLRTCVCSASVCACWQVLSGNIEHVPTKEKAKFAQEFFPDVRSFITCVS